MHIPIRIEPSSAVAAPVQYRWDEDTDILTAHVSGGEPEGRTLSVDLEGADGSWLILDVVGGGIRGVEVAVWPTVRKRSDLLPPLDVETVRAQLDQAVTDDRALAVEIDTPVSAESDRAERTLHFRLGTGRQVRTVRVARELLLDLDSRDRLAGVWLLDVPPFPGLP
jgi:hypothetical protein